MDAQLGATASYAWKKVRVFDKNQCAEAMPVADA